MNTVRVSTFRAEVTIGLNKGYTTEAWSLELFKKKLVTAQQKLKNDMNIVLSAKVTCCDIICLGQDEPTVTVSFINYPKFPLDKTVFKTAVIFVSKILMNSLIQNRIIVVFDDDTVMMERSDAIDRNIRI